MTIGRTTTPDQGDMLTGEGGDHGPDRILVRLRNVSVTYPPRRGLLSHRGEPLTAVDDISLEVRSGETLGVVGQTGAGKSTIARLVMGMTKPTSGSVEVAGHDVTNVRGDARRELDHLRQVVLQDPFSSLNPRMRVRDIIAEPLTLDRQDERRLTRRAVAERVVELLRLVGLSEDRADSFPHQFSGGQRQRISIARALAPRPELIVLDEPTSALDVSVRAQILSLLRSLQERLGLTYLVISHDLMTVAYLSSRVAVMYKGRVVEIGPMQEMYRFPRHPYTVRLFDSVPRLDVDFLSQPRLSEVEWSHDELPIGSCRYASDCELRRSLGHPRAEACRVEPGLQRVGPEHIAACHFPEEMGRLARASNEEPPTTSHDQ